MTGKCLDMVGERFGSLIVLSRSENSENGKRQWLCKWIPKGYQSRNTRRSVFTEEIVCEIRKDRDAGMTRGELVEKYKATEFNIDSVIYDKKSWQEVGHV